MMKMNEKMMGLSEAVQSKFHQTKQLKNSGKPFQMSYRRLLSIIFIILTVVSIISLTINTSLYMHRIEQKEKSEHNVNALNRTNRDAYAVVRFVAFVSVMVSIALRIFGLIAIGVCGREFASTEFESSHRRESFTGCLSYTCGMIILLAAYYVGIVRMVPHDLLIHCCLTILGAIFVAFSLQHSETYSKELNTDTLPI